MFETAMIAMVGTYGKLGLTAFMVVQTIIAIIPSEAVLMFAGAMGMGVIDVAIYGGGGLILGSIIAFFIARHGGRPVVVRIIGDKWTNKVDGWVTKHGMKAILATRLIPIIPFDLVSYVTGVTKMGFPSYLAATVVGAIPRCLFLAYAGSVAGGILTSLGTGLEVVFALGVAGIVAFMYMERKGYLDMVKDTIMEKVVERA